MKFKVQFKMDNEAFNPGNGDIAADMLRQLAKRIECINLDTRYSGPLLDVNGNNVGEWKVVK